jgi:hypothetical protein
VIARCVHNTGSALGHPARGHFYTVETIFHLELAKEYVVLGLGIFETVLLALVRDETGRPSWLPIGLFEFEGTALPADWEFTVVDGVAASGGVASDRWVARWGYAELVGKAPLSDALIEREPHALEIFEREIQKHSRKEAGPDEL